MGSTEIDVKILVEVAVTVALGTVLSNSNIYQLPYGGSITLSSMVPLFLIALRREPIVGIFTGAVHGMVQLALQTDRSNPAQLNS